MKKAYRKIIFLGVSIALSFVLYYQLTKSEDIYLVYQNSSNFFKHKSDSTRYVLKDNMKLYELAEYKKGASIKDISKLDNFNVISKDSLISIIPYSEYDMVNWNTKKLKKFNNTNIFIIEIDSVKKKLKIKQVYLPFIEYD